MNRTEALEVLKTINIPRKTVYGEAIGAGFFFADAAAAFGNWERAARRLSSLVKAGRVRVSSVQSGFTTHDFYSVIDDAGLEAIKRFEKLKNAR
jgi:hypothetical protein